MPGRRVKEINVFHGCNGTVATVRVEHLVRVAGGPALAPALTTEQEHFVSAHDRLSNDFVVGLLSDRIFSGIMHGEGGVVRPFLAGWVGWVWHRSVYELNVPARAAQMEATND